MQCRKVRNQWEYVVQIFQMKQAVYVLLLHSARVISDQQVPDSKLLLNQESYCVEFAYFPHVV